MRFFIGQVIISIETDKSAYSNFNLPEFFVSLRIKFIN